MLKESDIQINLELQSIRSVRSLDRPKCSFEFRAVFIWRHAQDGGASAHRRMRELLDGRAKTQLVYDPRSELTVERVVSDVIYVNLCRFLEPSSVARANVRLQSTRSGVDYGREVNSARAREKEREGQEERKVRSSLM